MPPIIAEDPSYDPNRDLGDSARRSHLAHGVDPLAFLVGPVEVVYGSDPSRTRVADLARSIDQKARVVRSNTGQLAWDYGRGLCTVNAPAAQGATGFLGRVGPVALGDVTIRSDNDYATILVVSLDGKPLARSARILIQAGTHAPADRLDRPRGHLPGRRRQADHPRPADRLDRHHALGHRQDEGHDPGAEPQPDQSDHRSTPTAIPGGRRTSAAPAAPWSSSSPVMPSMSCSRPSDASARDPK